MMNIVSARSASWGDAAHSVINAIVAFEGLGEVPFSARNDDIEEHGRDLFSRLSVGEFGAVAEYVAPVSEIQTSVTAWQMREALNQLDLRSAVEAAVAAADQKTKDGWEFAQEFKRDNLLIAAVAASIGKSDAGIDALFALAATLIL